MRNNDTRTLLTLLAAGAACLSAASLSAAPPANDPFISHNEQGDLLSSGGGGGPAFNDIDVQNGFGSALLVSGLGANNAAGGPGVNGFDTQIHVVLCDSNEVVKVDRAGTVTPFADLTGVVPEGRLVVPAFDVMGGYGGWLYVNNDPNKIYEVDAAGEPGGHTEIDAEGWRNDALACDPYGTFGGQLFLNEGDATGSLYTVGTDGAVELFARGTGGVGRGIVFASGGAGGGDGFGEAMYIANAERRRIYRVTPSHTPGAPAPVWVNLAHRGIRPVSMAISASGPFGAGVMYVADAQGRIVKLGPDGSYLGEFARNFDGPPTIELPRSGMFAGTMTVSVNGEIWTIAPECAADWNGNAEINSNDFFAFLTDFFAGNADFNADGATNSNDYFAFLSVFFSGCS